MMMEGEYDPATRTVTFYAKGTGPIRQAVRVENDEQARGR